MSGDRRQVVSIVLSMVATCVIGAAVLGGVYVATERHSEAQRRRAEQREVIELLGLDGSATVLEVRAFFRPARDLIVYRVARAGSDDPPRELTFDLEGRPLASLDHSPGSEPPGVSHTAKENPREELRPLGRVFVAYRGASPAGFVVEGTTQGYKNRIRFLVGLGADFEIAGVRVVEHEEDPGLGAEVATPEFEGQFMGRASDGLEVTRDPMPRDWRAALLELRRMAPQPWRARHTDLVDRERGKPIYAVTGATISSRALTDGVAATVQRFRSRWERIAPYVRDASENGGARAARPDRDGVGAMPAEGMAR